MRIKASKLSIFSLNEHTVRQDKETKLILGIIKENDGLPDGQWQLKDGFWDNGVDDKPQLVGDNEPQKTIEPLEG